MGLLFVAAACGAVAGVLGSFVHLLAALGLPAGLLLALLLSAGTFGTWGLLLGRPGAAAGTAGWLVVVLLLARARPEGDLVVDGSAVGYAWLLGGLLVAGGCLALPYRSAASGPPEDGR